MAASPVRRRAFALLALLIPLLLLAGLEGFLRALRYQGDLKLFTTVANVDPKYLGVNDRVANRYFTSVKTVPTPPTDLFLRAKPARGFRVFVMGESSTGGFPYGYNGTFSRVVRDALADVLPGNTVEVINLGIAATTTYALYDEIDEILEQQPDAVMIYAGHNEFYGALGAASTQRMGAYPAFVRSYLRLQRRFKTVLLAREVAIGLIQRVGALTGSSRDSSRSLMQQMVREELIPLESPTYRRGIQQFRDNLGAILTRFAEANVPVFVGSLTSNLRDQPPFRSVATASLPAAERVYAEAGQALARGARDTARALFVRARDLDGLRFRAPSEFNTVIRTLASTTGAYYVAVDETFASAARDHIPGTDLFWEHLHPNQTGYHLIGKTFFDAIARTGFLGRAADPARLRSWPAYYEEMSVTEFDRRFAWHQIRSVTTSWPFVKQEDPSGYPHSYRPVGAADSAAFGVVVLRQNSWPAAKFALAAHYRALGQLQNAYAEYRGLIRDQPENATIRVYAADVFMAVSDFERARILLEEAYGIEPSAFTAYALGHLEVEVKHADRAIGLLEQAQQFRADIPMVLYDLSRAYALRRDGTRARASADRLASVQPGFPGLEQLRAELARLPD
jgi:lysophospholipase L1-like esterase